MILAATVAEKFFTVEGHLPAKGARAFGGLVPLALPAGAPGPDNLANFIIGDFTALFIDNLELVARHRLAGGAVADVVRTVRQKRLEHFGRANAVEYIDAARLPPALAQRPRQRLAGGDA